MLAAVRGRGRRGRGDQGESRVGAVSVGRARRGAERAVRQLQPARIGGQRPRRHVRRGADRAVHQHGLGGGAARVDPRPKLALGLCYQAVNE